MSLAGALTSAVFYQCDGSPPASTSTVTWTYTLPTADTTAVGIKTYTVIQLCTGSTAADFTQPAVPPNFVPTVVTCPICPIQTQTIWVPPAAPSDTAPAGTVPAGSAPGSAPTGPAPDGSVPTGPESAGSAPAGSPPAGSSPADPGSPSAGSIPADSSAAGPAQTGTPPAGTPPTGTSPTGTSPTDTSPTGSSPTGTSTNSGSSDSSINSASSLPPAATAVAPSVKRSVVLLTTFMFLLAPLLM